MWEGIQTTSSECAASEYAVSNSDTITDTCSTCYKIPKDNEEIQEGLKRISSECAPSISLHIKP